MKWFYNRDMDIEEKINYWIEIAEYDLGTADAMLQTKRFLYVGFMCHQAIEKILKGYYVLAHEKTPPYIHNLSVLSEESKIYDEFTDEQKDFIDSLSPLNVKARYPAYKKKIMDTLDETKCKNILINTKELYQWIKKKLLKKLEDTQQ
jgi:HEPN domain-containing protein